jgi:hypothetical protein
VVTIARGLEIAARAEVERAMRRVREEGQDWRAVALLLGLDDLACTITDPAQLAFDYIAQLPAAPEFGRPRLLWDCPACGQTVADDGPGRSRAIRQQGHVSGCGCLASDVAEWEQEARR